MKSREVHCLSEFDYIECNLFGSKLGYDNATRTREIIEDFDLESDNSILILSNMGWYNPQDFKGVFSIGLGVSKRCKMELIDSDKHYSMTDMKKKNIIGLLYPKDLEHYGSSDNLIDLVCKAIKGTDVSQITDRGVVFLDKCLLLVAQDSYYMLHWYYIDRIVLSYKEL